jgi:hypothetical protein
MGKIYVLGKDGIERLLSTALVGRIACCATAIDGQPGRSLSRSPMATTANRPMR